VTHVAEVHAPTILVVDYDVARLASIRALLESEGFPVVVARDSAMATAVADGSVGLLLVADEMHLGPMRRLIGALRTRQPALRTVLLSGPRSSELSRETCEHLGVHAYLPGGDAPTLLRALDAARRTYHELSAARASERLKTELLAAVSHELRSPLHVILGYLDLVREGAYGVPAEAMRAALDKIAWNADHLLELVEDFLDLTKLETGGVRLERVDVGALVRALVADQELLVHGRPIALHAEVGAGVPPVLADGAKLRVVLQNLLSNALKFTEHGEIVATVAAPIDGVVQVRVRDTGPGIPADACEAVFDLYRQLQPGDMDRKGIGLGLALARRFARAMRGDLTVSSTVGKGSVFTLTLPAAAEGVVHDGGDATTGH
jgi:signal transduction histidine kinase